MPRTDERVDRMIGALLRAGVIIAVSIVFVGGIWYLAGSGSELPRYALFRGEPRELRNVGLLWHGVLSLQPRSWIQLGLLLLIATPMARVAFSAAAFAVQRDWLYVALTLFVLAVLVWSLSGAGFATL